MIVSPTPWTNQGRGSGVLVLMGGWNEVTTLKCPSLAKIPNKKQQWKIVWRRRGAASRTGPLNSNHRWHPQWIQTTKRMEMEVKEISGKPWLVKTKWRCSENQELYSKVHILNGNRHCLCVKTMMGTKPSHFIKNKGERDNLGFLKNLFPSMKTQSKQIIHVFWVVSIVDKM